VVQSLSYQNNKFEGHQDFLLLSLSVLYGHL